MRIKGSYLSDQQVHNGKVRKNAQTPLSNRCFPYMKEKRLKAKPSGTDVKKEMT